MSNNFTLLRTIKTNPEFDNIKIEFVDDNTYAAKYQGKSIIKSRQNNKYISMLKACLKNAAKQF